MSLFLAHCHVIHCSQPGRVDVSTPALKMVLKWSAGSQLLNSSSLIHNLTSGLVCTFIRESMTGQQTSSCLSSATEATICISCSASLLDGQIDILVTSV